MNKKLLQRYPTIHDCRAGARRRLPGFLFDFLDGGTDRELALSRNRRAFERITIMPQHGRAVQKPETTCSLFERTWRTPFGVCPCGYVDLVSPGTELATARVAEQIGAPFIASMSSISPLEELAVAAPTAMWMQIQHCIDAGISADIVERAKVCGISVLVVTMDIPLSSKRVRDIRNGFTLPISSSLKMVFDVLTSPRWTIDTLHRPNPKPGNFIKYLPDGVSATAAAIELEQQFETVTTWADFARFREQWPGKLVAKGILSADDARCAVECGADGIIVSNHGGRQFDGAPATIDCLPGVVAAVGTQVPVMLDSGVRGGLDVMRALLRGASFVFSGRSFYYTAGALGKLGAAHAFDLLREELEICMRQAGFNSIEEIAAASYLEREVLDSHK